MSKPNQTIEAVLLNRVKVVGDNEWKLTGTPDDLMKELEVAISSIVDETIELNTEECAKVALYMYEKWQEEMKPPLFAYYDFPTWLKFKLKKGLDTNHE